MPLFGYLPISSTISDQIQPFSIATALPAVTFPCGPPVKGLQFFFSFVEHHFLIYSTPLFFFVAGGGDDFSIYILLCAFAFILCAMKMHRRPYTLVWHSFVWTNGFCDSVKRRHKVWAFKPDEDSSMKLDARGFDELEGTT